MKGVTFETKTDYLGIPAGSIVQGIATDGISIGVALTEDLDIEKYPLCAGFGLDEPQSLGPEISGGWWYPATNLEPLTQDARDFVAAHLAAGGV